MTDTTSLVISIISLSGTILATAIGVWAQWYDGEVKQRREINKILLKYRDPLLLSAQDLQARLFGLCDTNQLDFLEQDEPGDTTLEDAIYIYTAYVVGQYLAWTFILRRQAQFRSIMSSGSPKKSTWTRKPQRNNATILMQKLELVSLAFRDNQHGEQEKPFRLFRPDLAAIGEIMSCQDSSTGEYYCIGYATFCQRWRNGNPYREKSEEDSITAPHKPEEYMAGLARIPDIEFRRAFRSVEYGIQSLWEHRQHSKEMTPDNPNNEGYDGRLRRLQHLLLDLIAELDPQGALNNNQEVLRVSGVDGCLCSLAPCHGVAPSKLRQRNVAGNKRSALTRLSAAKSDQKSAMVV